MSVVSLYAQDVLKCVFFAPSVFEVSVRPSSRVGIRDVYRFLIHVYLFINF